MICIEKGIPIPRKERPTIFRELRDTLHKMMVGDSVFIKNKCENEHETYKTIHTITAVCSDIKRIKKREGCHCHFTSRTVKEENGVRIWRTE